MIREARPGDDAALSAIVRAGLAELGVALAAAGRDDIDALSAAGPRAGFLVVEEAGRVLGGGGYGSWAGGPADTCELRRMYLTPDARGRGLGRALLSAILERARADGYAVCALETSSSMLAARGLYAAFGFRPPAAPLPRLGCGCDLQLMLNLR